MDCPQELDVISDEDLQLLSKSAGAKSASHLARAILSIANLKMFIKQYLMADGDIYVVEKESEAHHRTNTTDASTQNVCNETSGITLHV